MKSLIKNYMFLIESLERRIATSVQFFEYIRKRL